MCLVVTWGDKSHHSKHPPLLFFLPALHAEHDARWSGVSLWSAGVTWPAWVPSQGVHPRPRHCGGGVRSRKGLGCVQALLSNSKTIYQRCFQHKPQTLPCPRHCKENELYPKQNQHSGMKSLNILGFFSGILTRSTERSKK